MIKTEDFFELVAPEFHLKVKADEAVLRCAVRTLEFWLKEYYGEMKSPKEGEQPKEPLHVTQLMTPPFVDNPCRYSCKGRKEDEEGISHHCGQRCIVGPRGHAGARSREHKCAVHIKETTEA